MLKRAGLGAAALLVLAGVLALAPGDVLDLELLWRRGQFELARELIDANRQAGNHTPQFLNDAGRAAAEMHDHALAAELYGELAAAVAGSPDAYRDARELEWRSRLKVDGPGGDWAASAEEEIATRLGENALRKSAKRRLALELQYLLDAILHDAEPPAPELREDYPGSDVVLRAAKAALDGLGTEPDDQQRLKLIDAFLAAYPGCYWRHAAWRLKLYTAWRLRDKDLLSQAGADYLAEYPDHPQSLGAVSRYYFDADLEPEAAFEYAERGVELYETSLGLDGSLESMTRLNDATRDDPPQRDYLPPATRQRFLEYLGSRYNLARYQVLRGEWDAALTQVEPIIELSPFTADEEQTLAPFHLIAAQAAEQAEDYPLAYQHYLAAAVAGDSRNRYALQAEQALPEAEKLLSRREIEAARAALIPAELTGVQLPSFTDASEELGLSGVRGRRPAWGDVDADGDPDLIVDGHLLLRNDRGAAAADRFVDVSRAWGLSGRTRGSVLADYDNDGDLDLYSFGHGQRGDRLWRNEVVSSSVPTLRFVDVTAISGDPSDADPSEGAAWLDYDGDGHIDLYVANYEQPPDEAGGYGVGTADRLYRNEGGARLVAVDPPATGITPPGGAPLASRGAVACADFDNDGDQDIFVGNYRLQENLLWRNGGDGSFTNAARLVGAAGWSVDGWWGHTIGAAWGDIDNDGDLDLAVANLAHPRYAYISDKSQLLISEPGLLGTMLTDRRADCGIKYAETTACPVFFDANCDGHLDLLLTATYDSRAGYLYLNDGQGRLHDVTFLAGARVLDGWGAAWADYDRDGDLDLAISAGGRVKLLRNDSEPAGGLAVRCVGAAGTGIESDSGALSNAAGIGSRVTVKAGDLTMLREIQSGSGSGCGNELIAHFGLGTYAGEVTVQVRFPSGRELTLPLDGANRMLTVYESAALPPAAASEATEELPADDEGDTADAEEEAADEDASGILERPTDTRGGG